MRSRMGRRRFAKKTQDLIWVSVPLAIAVSETPGVTQLLTGTSWTAVPGVGFERGTLLRIAGWLGYNQATNGTAGSSYLSWALVKQELGGGAINTTNAAGLNAVDILRVGGWCTQGTVASANAPTNRVDIDMPVKRKIDISEEIAMHAMIGTDAASPTAGVFGVLRFLINRN